MNKWQEQLMHAPSLILTRCPFCGRTATNNHHIVPRSQGGTAGPMISVCGMGNASGCHGLLHQHKLHLRYDFERKRWQFIYTPKSTKWETALKMSGWQDIGRFYTQALEVYGAGKVPNRGTRTNSRYEVGENGRV